MTTVNSEDQIDYPSVLATLTGANLNSTAKQTIYTVPAGKTLIVSSIVTKNVSTSLTTAVFGFGFNASANDVVAAALHTSLTGSTLFTIDNPISGAKTGAASDVFGIKCSIAQGSTATADIILIGILV